MIKVKIGKYLSLLAIIFFIGFCNLGCEKKVVENAVVISGVPVILTDPALAVDWYDTQVAYNLYSPLVYPTPDGRLRPHLALHWQTVDDKLDHWRFTIRAGVKFHDGSELTAEDVVFSMKRFLDMEKGYSSMLGKLSAIASSRYMVDFILEKPNAIFPYTLTLFWPVNKDLVLEHIQPGNYGRFGDYGEDWLMTHDAGCGPYMMTSHSPGERMEAVRFEEYFLGWENWGWDPARREPGSYEVPIDRLIYIMEYETSTLMLLLKSGQLHLETNGAFSRRTLREIVDTEGIHLNQTWSQDWTVWMNTKVPPTDDVHFRRAILYAYDYEAVLEEYTPFGAREAGIYSTTLPGYIPIPPQPRRQDLEKARGELALSKYDPTKVKVVFHYCAGLEAQQEIGLQLQADLAKLGVKVEIAGPPWPQYEAECGAPETTPNMTIFMFPSAYPSPDFFMFYMYYPDNIRGIYSAHWYVDEKIGHLIDQSRRTLDFQARLEIYRKLQEKLASQALALYPYEIPSLFTSQDYLIGPKETFPMVGPTVNMHNWRINLAMKQGR